MKEAYEKSLQMIKVLNIKNEKEYNKLLKYYLILSSESLKARARTRRFKKIIKLTKEVWKGFYYICVRKWHFSTIVDKKYVISKIGHTKDKGGKAWE